eukprot:CAMPEP_0179035156 /NCGR_PEP_ID=MMETSP0796-20121207/12969_1 /TAXON_ID=73915 /ORGANISM="Pyrodinium bahamense, Strain pbaha01" /LENGTH=287 /DNA_ID=CAMNT_0020731427 /DNA_START=64 /DNA_END=927 /DNA_ORIENTATION=-
MAAVRARAAVAALLFLGALWTVPTFIPAMTSGPRSAMSSVAQRQGATSAPPGAASSGEGAMGLATLGLLALALSAGAKDARGRQLATPRRFFGGGAAPPPPPKPTSYKDFQDPWLGAADLGFDPLNLAIQGGIFDTAASAVPETTYYNYRESEVKHGRFAMIAFLAIFGEEADRNALLRQLGNTNVADTLDSTLGLDEVQLPILAIGIGYQALAEYNLQREEDDGNFLSVEYKRDRIPGDLGFDPLGLSKGAGADVTGLHNTEVNAGRLAMIGVTSFLFKEFLIKDL